MLRIFSPAYDFKKFKEKMRGLSEEFLHDLARLYVRPNSSSTNHWLDRSFVRVYNFLTPKLSNKQAYPLFDAVLDEGSTDKHMKWDNSSIRNHMGIALLERDYGLPENSPRDYKNAKQFENLVKELYESIKNNMKSTLNYDELAVKLILDFYRRIPNFNEELFDKYNNV